MNINHDDIKPSPTLNAAESSAITPQTSVGDPQQALLDEIRALSKSGENPSRLRDLLIARDAERVRQIDELLAQEPDQALAKLIEGRRLSFEIMQPFEEAMKRRDLTMPGMIFLAKLHQRNVAQLRKSLVAEKDLIERKRQPGTFSRRGSI